MNKTVANMLQSALAGKTGTPRLNPNLTAGEVAETIADAVALLSPIESPVELPPRYVDSFFDQTGEEYDSFIAMGAGEWFAHIVAAGVDLAAGDMTASPPWGGACDLAHAVTLESGAVARVHVNHSLCTIGISLDLTPAAGS